MRLMGDAKSRKLAFQNVHSDVDMKMTKDTCERAAASITATRLVNKALQVRKFFAGTLLKAVRSINKMVITKRNDFGEGSW